MTSRAQIPLSLAVLFAACSLLIASVFLFLGFRLARTGLPEQEEKLLALVYQQIDRSYYKDLDDGDKRHLVEEAIKGMVKSLDRYSRFIPSSERQEFDEVTSGIYFGIGTLMHNDNGRIVVLFPFPGGPAETAGIQPGDVISSVDGVTIASLGEPKIRHTADRIKGPKAGVTVRLEVQRREATLPIEVARGAVPQPSVRQAHFADQQAGIGYVYIADFVEQTGKEFEAALRELSAEGATKLRGLLIDLRDNSGGSLDVCVGLCNRFLGSGRIVTLTGNGTADKPYDADPTRCDLPDLPLVILVNERSASASEVMAGALQDHGRARIVGTRSYGKGLVQSIFSWKDLPIRLKLTTAEYRTPKGRNIHDDERDAGARRRGIKGGIQPDVPIQVSDETALAISTGLASYEIPKVYRAVVDQLAARLNTTIEKPLPSSADPQLAAAIDEMRSTLGLPESKAQSKGQSSAVSKPSVK